MSQKTNLNMDQGSTFNVVFNITDSNDNPLDLTIYTASAQMRKTYTSVNSYAFTVLTDNAGNLTLNMIANTTSSLLPGRYVYDIDIVDINKVVLRLTEGIITITPQVTKVIL
jgi:hypothetical protein